MAKLTTVVGARFEQSDQILEEFKSIMADNNITQSTLVKLIFRYALMEKNESFRNWIAEKTIIVK